MQIRDLLYLVLFFALGMAVEIFFLIATGLNPWQLKKNWERTARPRFFLTR